VSGKFGYDVFAAGIAERRHRRLVNSIIMEETEDADWILICFG
jgi:hypothetical protein